MRALPSAARSIDARGSMRGLAFPLFLGGRSLLWPCLELEPLHSRSGCTVKRKVIAYHITMGTRLARKPQNAYHHGDLRDALVDAALREAELGGPEAISINALAKK